MKKIYFLSILIMIGMALSAQNWLSYYGDVLPAETIGDSFTLDLTKTSSDSPGATFTETIVDDAEIAGNKLLEYLQPDGKKMYRSDFPADFTSTDFTVVARVKGIDDPTYSRAMDIQFRNGNAGFRDELRITPGDSTIELSKSEVVSKVDIDLYGWHIYRVVVVGIHASVYIDENTEVVIEADMTSTTSDNYIKFGDESSDAIGGYLDWIVVWLGSENPALPTTLTGLTTDPGTGVINHKAQLFEVYPNPVQNQLMIRTGVEKSQLSIFNITGAQVISKEIGSEVELDVNALKNGVYFLHIQNNQYNSFKKFIKK